MGKQDLIFVQIASYRDCELVPTLIDLYQKAKYPKRIFSGICQQYGPGEIASPNIKQISPQQLRWISCTHKESKGVCWARKQAQSLYQDEDYVLSIDSHMRFVANWDEILISELRKCKANKPIISNHPPAYTPPDIIEQNAKLTILRATPATENGDIRLRGEPLDTPPKSPLPGAFAAPGFWFAKGSIIEEIPYDPYLYFEQEEMCFSARLYTHGWQIFHPSKIAAYHLYNDMAAVIAPRYYHWHDNPNWVELNDIANMRRDHLLGYAEATNSKAIKDLDIYGHGTEHSLEEYGEFCGIDFANRLVTKRAINGEFIPKLHLYKASTETEKIATNAQINSNSSKQNNKAEYQTAESTPTNISFKSTLTNVPIESFKPCSTDILQGLPLGDKKHPAPKIIDSPPGVLIIENFASKEFCRKLRDYADSMAGTKLKVVDHNRSTKDKLVTADSSGRITDHVCINGAVGTILPTFIDIYENRLAPFFGVQFEWFERPQILRYPAGGKYDPHSDAEYLDEASGQWIRSQDRDISVLLYLNDDYSGGEIAFTNIGFQTKPKTGMLLAFFSDHRYLHAAMPTTSGMRYTIVSWAAVTGTPRAQSQAPYASVFLNVPPA